jgi:hypothetical protein
MKKLRTIRLPALVASAFFLLPAFSAYAEDVDFSCMSYRVWGKGHMSDQYKSYDIVVQNQCPGDVYWAMCIERMDPDTHKVVETHKPTGYVQEGKKARVNLNLRKHPDPDRFRNRFQEFYVDIGYAIDGAATPACMAAQCESRKTDVRKKISTNEKAWEKADRALAAQIKEACPDTGWDTVASKECEENLRAASQEAMEQFAALGRELREQIAAIDPDTCQVHSGDLTEED